jgi:hypothetical protein
MMPHISSFAGRLGVPLATLDRQLARAVVAARVPLLGG